MSLSTLPLGYCTNVHPGRKLDEVIAGVRRYTAAVGERIEQPLAAGLWLAEPVVRELSVSADAIEQLKGVLDENALVCYTLNAFPFGDFHSERVKEQVYIPDWTTTARRDYTLNCGRLLAEIMPEGVEGSLSTVPLGFKELCGTGEAFIDECIVRLIETAKTLDDLHDETGRVVRLAIEPEPLCVIETTPEAIAFFKTLFERAADAGVGDAVRRHIGLCYDVCHQSVEFEDVTESIASLNRVGIRINKVHITCAVRLEQPGTNNAGREALRHFVEPRYLHQTFARVGEGKTLHQTDLDAALCDSPSPEFAAADEWRVHFHVPVDAEEIGPLRTTRPDLKLALDAIAGLEYAPHLEVETYTWGVLPGEKKPELADGIAAELLATHKLLDEIVVTE